MIKNYYLLFLTIILGYHRNRQHYIKKEMFHIKGGKVIDPANGLNELCDVIIDNGMIAGVGEPTKMEEIKNNLEEKYSELKQRGQKPVLQEFDARGCIVCPGLIDLHTHLYEFSTPLGINADQFCLARGVTTAVDAGSAGAGTLAGLAKFVRDQSNTRVLAFIHIASHGLAAAGCAGFGAWGECDSLNQVDVDLLKTVAQKFPDLVVGVKVRLTKDVCDNGKNEEEVYRRALRASENIGKPLMVHHTFSSIPTQPTGTEALSCPGSLRPGDIYTHCLHGYPSTIVDPETQQIYPDVKLAKERGVFFDVGHGQGSFTWTVAELCAKQNFYCDVISTDLHSGNTNGPAYDLVAVMTKMLHVGMTLYDVIKAVTLTPAKVISKSHSLGSLTIGNEADVTVLKVEHCDLDLEDCQGQMRKVKNKIIPIAVWRNGKQFEIIDFEGFPNRDLAENLRPLQDLILVKDS